MGERERERERERECVCVCVCEREHVSEYVCVRVSEFFFLCVRVCGCLNESEIKSAANPSRIRTGQALSQRAQEFGEVHLLQRLQHVCGCDDFALAGCAQLIGTRKREGRGGVRE